MSGATENLSQYRLKRRKKNAQTWDKKLYLYSGAGIP